MKLLVAKAEEKLVDTLGVGICTVITGATPFDGEKISAKNLVAETYDDWDRLMYN